MKPTDILSYINLLSSENQEICNLLNREITNNLKDSTSKIRHGHPVWFLNNNPIVWFSLQKKWIVLLFWSGQDFNETELKSEWSFKAAEVTYTHIDQINISHINRWLEKAKIIQRDYKNIVKRKGVLEKIL